MGQADCRRTQEKQEAGSQIRLTEDVRRRSEATDEVEVEVEAGRQAGSERAK